MERIDKLKRARERIGNHARDHFALDSFAGRIPSKYDRADYRLQSMLIAELERRITDIQDAHNAHNNKAQVTLGAVEMELIEAKKRVKELEAYAKSCFLDNFKTHPVVLGMERSRDEHIRLYVDAEERAQKAETKVKELELEIAELRSNAQYDATVYQQVRAEKAEAKVKALEAKLAFAKRMREAAKRELCADHHGKSGAGCIACTIERVKNKKIRELERLASELEKLARNPDRYCYICNSRASLCGCDTNVHDRIVDAVIAQSTATPQKGGE